MWLLSTDRAELHSFAAPEDVPGGYAILSHVWDTEEMSFQDVKAISADCAKTRLFRRSGNPRDRVSPKLRGSCILAEKQGHKWIWIDTCCIDKTSSVELSEAINSMFRYYALSTVCYAFLRDVHNYKRRTLERSRWHQRGWTLQELVAPKFLVFVSAGWEVMGTKTDLADLIESFTGVPASVLRFEVDLADVSIAQRMSWARNRQTTRLEDEAYCLMGIFGINMPTLYGEGRKAFYRLQEEIMKTSVDTSLFIWNCGSSLEDYRSSPAPKAAFNPNAPCLKHLAEDSYLLAPSPSAFGGDLIKQARFSPLANKQCRITVLPPPLRATGSGIPTFSSTSYGILARMPVVESAFGEGTAIALTSCLLPNDRTFALLLVRCPSAPDPLRPRYHTAMNLDAQNTCRTLLVDSMVMRRRGWVPEWKEIYLTHSLPFRADVSPQPRWIMTMNGSLDSPFRIPSTTIEDLKTNFGIEICNTSTIPAKWLGSPPVAFRLKLADGEMVRHCTITLGMCMRHQRKSTNASTGHPSSCAHWATVGHVDLYESKHDKWRDPPMDTHDCATHHIDHWPMDKVGGVRCWRMPRSDLFVVGLFSPATASLASLVFTKCPMNLRGDTLVMQVA